ncbi:LysR family transcriptional regulator [Sporosarcina oncorhynchi]|uniref:LysR family transcriptional regulator n=1 Tax=Sporosarcina oncorhynchi TaxID=3056444 RepID=A0ABZ0L7Q8_9BACL|nr:LysR family transcriptional regulator [Sporosarcina sp. T2O-4]WOV88160.1 LysR family transcriptional regulator [Sporosarcina sp. T2O-4]
MDLRHLQTFHIVSSHLNFTKAAQILNYSQPTVSQQIKALEAEFGHTLLNRVGKKMYLTPAGHIVKRHTESLFGKLDSLTQELKKLEKPAGSLVIASPEFYCGRYLAHIIGPYIKLYPDVNLKLICCNSEETLKLVSSNQADIGFVAGDLTQSGIERRLIDEEELFLVAHPRLSIESPLQNMFDAHPFITYSLTGLIHNCLEEIQCVPKTIVECGSEEAIKQAVLGQAGIALLSDRIIEDEIKNHELQVLSRFSYTMPTYLISPENMKDFSTVSTFTDLTIKMWDTL